uniref:ABC transmembrane type-1 domain-containing protein n=1 Tax=Parascaris equorum TaxID=6256 RepID=A0A914S6H5_PAREQ
MMRRESNFRSYQFQHANHAYFFRGDLAKQKLEAKPVSFFELFRFASTFDKFLVTCGILLALLCGIGIPMTTVLGGRLTNALIVTDTYEGNDEFRKTGYTYVILFAVIGVAMVAISYTQVFFYLAVCGHSLSST